MDIFLTVIGIILGLALPVLLVLWSLIRSATIFEYERGMLYRNGRFLRLLPPGRHWFIRLTDSIQKVNMRSRSVTIPGQDILTADNISLKISLAASFRVQDPYLAMNQTTNFVEDLYQILQIELRDLIGASEINDLLAKRREIGTQLLTNARPKAAVLGVELIFADVKDIMFPGELKSIFAQVVNARNEGLAALERARGETAALRNLANGAKLLEDHPGLYQLRLLQAVSNSSGNTIILGLPPESIVMPPEKKS